MNTVRCNADVQILDLLPCFADLLGEPVDFQSCRFQVDLGFLLQLDDKAGDVLFECPEFVLNSVTFNARVLDPAFKPVCFFLALLQGGRCFLLGCVGELFAQFIGSGLRRCPFGFKEDDLILDFRDAFFDCAYDIERFLLLLLCVFEGFQIRTCVFQLDIGVAQAVFCLGKLFLRLGFAASRQFLVFCICQ